MAGMFDKRELSHVTFYSFIPQRFVGGAGLTISLGIGVTNYEGDLAGPNVTVNFQMQADLEQSIQNAERAVLERAVALLSRMARETTETLHQKLRHPGEPDNTESPSR